jgi:hypothetical protein
MYRITVGDYTYVGSTKDFKQRKSEHKSSCKIKEYKIYQIIREAGGWDKCEMIPIEEYECEGLLQARMREEYWRREYNANMNSIKSHITEEEQIEQIKEKNKAYREANTEKRQTKHECNCGGKYSIMHKARHETTKRHQDYLATDNHLPLI